LDAVQGSSTDAYIAAFRARCDVSQRPGQPEIDALGVQGLLSWADDPLARLLVIDDRAYELLEVVLPDVQAGVITVPCARRPARAHSVPTQA
jgi:hypothetical protein